MMAMALSRLERLVPVMPILPHHGEDHVGRAIGRVEYALRRAMEIRVLRLEDVHEPARVPVDHREPGALHLDRALVPKDLGVIRDLDAHSDVQRH